MDGTGKLFQPFINELPDEIDYSIISYPENKCLSYNELEAFVMDKLPKDEDFVLLAESFSGPIGYLIAQKNLANMKTIIFVATFLRNPNKPLINIVKLMPLRLLLTLPIPKFIIKQFFLGNNPDNQTIAAFKETLKNISSEVLSFRINEMSKLSLDLDKITMKTYYIQALDDKLVSSDNLSSFKKISNELKTIKINGPHFILQARPKECAKLIADKLSLIAP